MQRGRAHGGVGRYRADHRRHGRRDHTRALDDARDGDGSAADAAAGDGGLDAGVRCHYRADDGVVVGGTERTRRRRDALADLRHRQAMAYHAGRCDQDFVRPRGEHPGRVGGHRLGVFEPAGARAHVGASGVDHERPHLAIPARQDPANPQHRRPDDLVPRGHHGRRGVLLGRDDRQVLAALLYPAAHARGKEAARKRNVSIFRHSVCTSTISTSRPFRRGRTSGSCSGSLGRRRL